MPTYLYALPNGTLLEREFPIGQAPDRVEFGDVVATRAHAAEMRSQHFHNKTYEGGVRPERGRCNTKIRSHGWAVQPKDVAKAKQAASKHGLTGVNWEKGGVAVFDNRPAEERYTKFMCEGKLDGQ